MAKVNQKIAIITGAARGIGRGIALKFAQEGYALTLCDLNMEGLNETVKMAEAKGVKAIGVRTNVSKKADIEAMVAQTISQLGVPDVLVNNAGTFKGGPFHEISQEDWQFTLDVNLTSVFLVSQQVLRCWLERNHKGNIVNLASLVTGTTLLNSSDYIASKCGVEGLTRSIALEYAKHGIRANNVSPGIVDSEMSKGGLSNPETRAKWDRNFQLGRPGQPADIAEAVFFLASDSASYITGQNLFVDGGWRLE